MPPIIPYLFLNTVSLHWKRCSCSKDAHILFRPAFWLLSIFQSYHSGQTDPSLKVLPSIKNNALFFFGKALPCLDWGVLCLWLCRSLNTAWDTVHWAVVSVTLNRFILSQIHAENHSRICSACSVLSLLRGFNMFEIPILFELFVDRIWIMKRGRSKWTNKLGRFSLKKNEEG